MPTPENHAYDFMMTTIVAIKQPEGCHSGRDPESIQITERCNAGCRIKSGMAWSGIWCLCIKARCQRGNFDILRKSSLNANRGH
jgi:hypothetical protein